MLVLTTADMATLAVQWHLRSVPLIEELPAESIGHSPASLSLSARKAVLDVLLKNGAFVSPPPSLEAIPKLAQHIEHLLQTYRLKQPEARIELLTLQTEIARSGSKILEHRVQSAISGVRLLDEILDSLQRVSHLCCKRLNCDDESFSIEKKHGLSTPELRHLLRSPLQAALSNTEFLIEKSQHDRVSDVDLQDIVECIHEAALVLTHRLN